MSYALEVPICVRKAAPPRSSNLRRKRRILNLGLLRKLAALILCGAMSHQLLISGMRPYREAHLLNDQAAHLRRQIQLEEQRHELLERRVAELQTPQGQQIAARTYGWLTKGEIPIACPHPDTALSRKSDAEIVAAVVSPAPTAMQRLKTALEW